VIDAFLQLVDVFKVNVLGIVTALIIGPFAIWVAKRVGLVDIPGSAAHKQHSQLTPLAGGLAIALSAVILVTILRLWKSPFAAILAAAAIIFAFGLWDDIKGLSASPKLIGQALAAIVLISANVYVRILGDSSVQTLGPWVVKILNWLITAFWLIGITNSVNFIDSMDGLAVGVTQIAFAFFMIMALAAQQGSLAIFSAIFLGICLGLEFYNTIPARLFLGDSGAQTLGFILAAVAIVYTPHDLPQASSWFVPIMVLAVPIFDTTLVVVSRLRRRRPVFKGELNHTYHRLVALGLAPNQAVLVIHITSLFLCFLAFIALSLVPWQAILVFSSSVFTGIALIIYFECKFPGLS
jgi:UDP-GlcNAc:undecaprenyl-phosphate/decaprenyl-phosphate GlcNAc-1-phosphate transferase